MELNEFVTETLSQIIDGIVAAQEYAMTKGAKINPMTGYSGGGTERYFYYYDERTGEHHAVQLIDFDVAITTTEGDKGKAGIGVFPGVLGIGTQIQSEASLSQANRIRFVVPILLPVQK